MTRSYRSVTRAQGAQATGQRVVLAAGRLFATQGYAATSVRQIAGEAGVALDRVYALGNKAAVFAAALEAVLSGRLDGRPLLDDPEIEVAWKSRDLEAILDVLAQATVGALARGAGIWSALVEAAGSDPALAQVLLAQNEAMRDQARATLARLVELGICPEPERPDRVADLMWALGHPSRHALLVGHAGWSEVAFLADLRTSVLALLG